MNMNEDGCRTEEAGFTLIEMLVVLAILAVTSTFAAAFVLSASEGIRLEIVASELAEALRVTRSAAITQNTETTFLIDVDRRTFRSTVVSQRSFSPNIGADLKFASGIGSQPSDGGFHFFSDGSSTGGEVTLSLQNKQERLCIDWLTGMVRRAKVC